uniref:Uncharacterized protein n=1 Tax=Bosea sp. NBC_00436 TaxID=2969620 RepID=A0A9E7ZMZ9_9HYPH
MLTESAQEKQPARAKSRKYSIRSDDHFSTAPGAPSALAWQLGKGVQGRVAFKCPCCGGWHPAPDIASTQGDIARVTTCPDRFRMSEIRYVNLRMVGDAPPHIVRLFSEAVPMGDLIVACDNLAADWHSPLPGRRADWFRREIFLPRWTDVDFAVRALRGVGFNAEATAIRRLVAPLARKNAYELSISNRWREVGPVARALILSSMQNAWECGGRL